MIRIHLEFGLGNQLFQIFTYISYCLDNNIEFVFSNKVNCDRTEFKRKTYWTSFFSHMNEYIVDSTMYYSSNIHYHLEHFSYYKIPKLKDDTIIVGFFQTSKYFEHNKQKIFNIINLYDWKKKLHNIYNFNNSISLHFRIGDYKYKQDSYPIMEIDYYINAINYITKHKQIDNILYFNQQHDDQDVKLNIDILKEKFPNINFIQTNKLNLKDYEEMILMSLCENNIIANSTFSWWGAYLNLYKEKIICYPSIWFGPSLSQYNTKDLCSNEWIKIDC